MNFSIKQLPKALAAPKHAASGLGRSWKHREIYFSPNEPSEVNKPDPKGARLGLYWSIINHNVLKHLTRDDEIDWGLIHS